MTVSRYATQAGRKFQRDVAAYLRTEHGLDAESMVQAGALDEGDVVIRHPNGLLILEAKRTKSLDLAGWVGEARAEAENYARKRLIETPGWAAVSARRNHSIGRAYVITELAEWIRQLSRG
jgi:hypothetical protein